MAEIAVQFESINHLNDLKAFEGKDITIHKMVDQDVRMVTIKIDDVFIMSGNFGDFYPGCHGGWHYELEKETFSWFNQNGMAEALEKALIKRGAKSVKIERSEYDWAAFTA